MAETYAPILPGNWSIQANAYALPNSQFKANKRPTGDPRDRNQQSILFMPGWQAIHKVGYAHIDGATSLTELEVIVPSPHTRPDDKPLADIKGLMAPKGALLYRIGLRVPPVSMQPGYFTSGAPGRVQTPPGPDGLVADDAGLIGVAGHMLALSSVVPAGAAAGTLAAGAAGTGTDAANPLKFGADKRLLSGSTSVTEGFGPATDSIEALTADLTFKIYSVDAGGAAGAAFATDMLGGIYLVAEICYLVPAAVADLDVLPLPGARYAGYEG